MTDSLPDGWEHLDPAAPYEKLVKRGAVEVPKRHNDVTFQRDSVVLITESGVGVTKGPGAREQWDVDDPAAAATAVAGVLEEWIGAGEDPYGGPELIDRLDEVIADV